MEFSFQPDTDKYPSLASRPKAILLGNFSQVSFKKFLSFIAALPKITFSTPDSIYFLILSILLTPPPTSIFKSNFLTISCIISRGGYFEDYKSEEINWFPLGSDLSLKTQEIQLNKKTLDDFLNKKAIEREETHKELFDF